MSQPLNLQPARFLAPLEAKFLIEDPGMIAGFSKFSGYTAQAEYINFHGFADRTLEILKGAPDYVDGERL